MFSITFFRREYTRQQIHRNAQHNISLFIFLEIAAGGNSDIFLK